MDAIEPRDACGRSSGMLAIIRKRRFLDFGRAGVVENAAKFDAQVLEIAAGSRMFQKFFNDRLELGQ